VPECGANTITFIETAAAQTPPDSAATIQVCIPGVSISVTFTPLVK
jgi:hypothetical protein